MVIFEIASYFLKNWAELKNTGDNEFFEASNWSIQEERELNE